MRLQGVRRSPVASPSEKVEQQHIVQLIRSIGGSVYVLGTRRKRGDFQGTCQTPGIPDLYVFLPASPRPGPDGAYSSACALWVEVKAAGGRARPEQQQFQQQCEASQVAHVLGGLDAVIAFLIAGGWIRESSVPHYRRPAEATRNGLV